MVRAFAILVFALLLCSCASNKHFLVRKKDEQDGGVKIYIFSYGKYCGPGLPATSSDDRLAGLLMNFPLVDDVDAACYAHDACYALTQDNDANCDSAIESTTLQIQSHLGSTECWNLATDLTLAFSGKPYSKGGSAGETSLDRAVQTGIGSPFSLFWATLKSGVRPFIGYPNKGCNLSEISDPERIINIFTEHYKNAPFNRDRKPIAIPKSQ